MEVSASGALEAHGYCLIGALGRGSQGAVYTVRHLSENAVYVLKRMHIMEPEARRTALLEAETLRRLRHTGVVGYRDTFVDDEYLCLVMEHADGGDLGSKVAQNVMQPFSEEQILRWFVQLALALHHVHERGVLHRDLKTQNVFVSSAGHVKLGDFGIAKSISESIPLAETCVGTPYYMPPELFRGEQYDAKADVWALGCILYELTTRRRAFQSPNLNSLSVKVMRGDHGPLPMSYSNGLHELIRSLLTVSTDRRPSLDTVLTTPILRRHIAVYAEEMLAPYTEAQQLGHPALGALRSQLSTIGFHSVLHRATSGAEGGGGGGGGRGGGGSMQGETDLLKVTAASQKEAAARGRAKAGAAEAEAEAGEAEGETGQAPPLSTASPSLPQTPRVDVGALTGPGPPDDERRAALQRESERMSGELKSMLDDIKQAEGSIRERHKKGALDE